MANIVREKVSGRDGKLSVLVTNNSIISKINKRFLGREGSTNVISFSYLNGDVNGEELYVGDIVISVEKAEEEAANSGITIRERFSHLFIHGLLHIYGYDHEMERERVVMESLEEEILKETGIG